MNKDTVQAIVDIVETWNIEKLHGREFTHKDMRGFVERMNAMTRRMISILGRQSPEFYVGLAELATNAQTLTTPNARIIADGIDRTDV